MNLPRILVAGVASGAGKTTVSMGLALLLREGGLRVQPFKVGPDYIDPGYLSAAAGRACRNLDTWLVPPRMLPALLTQACRDADLALIEGVMGLYDGIGATAEQGSSAEMAKLLGCPVLLVVDASAASRSVAAVVKGFVELDRKVQVAGCFLNRVAGLGHCHLVKEAVERLTGVPVVGFLPLDDRLRIPERHLGLVPAAEERRWRPVFRLLAQRMREGTDLQALLRTARRAAPLPDVSLRGDPPEAGRRSNLVFKREIASAGCAGLAMTEGGWPRHDGQRVPIAVARDEAFHFYYPENLELLEAFGAELVPFSPLKARRLPTRAAGLYLGGGFPEQFAGPLSRNRSLRQAIREAVEARMPVYAECGGLMFLAESIRGSNGRAYPMVGVLPARVWMTDRLQSFGYQRVLARRDNLLAREGEEARGHEFHHSRLSGLGTRSAAYEAVSAAGQNRRLEGYARRNLLASYIHLHFFSQPRWARRFVESARRFQGEHTS